MYPFSIDANRKERTQRFHSPTELGDAGFPDARLDWRPAFLSANEADGLKERLFSGVSWEQHRIRLFGRTVDQPRLAAWFGEPHCSYRYSGLALEPLPFPRALTRLRDRILAETRCWFNCALCNLYRTGFDSVAWHSDDEPELGNNPPIASVSLGATRRFQMRHRQDPRMRFELPLTHGTLLLMTGSTQHAWAHQVPREKRVTEPRISITFRCMEPPA